MKVWLSHPLFLWLDHCIDFVLRTLPRFPRAYFGTQECEKRVNLSEPDLDLYRGILSTRCAAVGV